MSVVQPLPTEQLTTNNQPINDQQMRDLNAIIPDSIVWIHSEALADAMNISLTQLRRDAAVLKALGSIRQEEMQQRYKGFDRHDSEVMWLFRQLVRERGRVQAINSIQQFAEDFYHERDGQESSRARMEQQHKTAPNQNAPLVRQRMQNKG